MSEFSRAPSDGLPMAPWMTELEVVEWLGITAEEWERMIAEGELQPRMHEGLRLLKGQDVQNLMRY